MDKKKTYSAAEKKAYYMGIGAAIGYGRQIKKAMNEMPPKIKESFLNGLDKGFLNKTVKKKIKK